MAKLTDVTGIGPATVKLLSEHNIKTVEALASISLAEVQKIPGMSGDIRARAVKKAAADCLRSKVTKELSTPANKVQTTVKKVASKKIAAKPPVNQVEADEVKDMDKKKKKKKRTTRKKKKKIRKRRIRTKRKIKIKTKRSHS